MTVRVAGPALTLLALFAPAGHAGRAETPTYTEAWEGDWFFDHVVRVCEIPEVVDETNFNLTFCAGDAVFGAGVWTCDGTLDDDGYMIECTFSSDASPDCVRTRTVRQTFALSGDAITGLQTLTTTYSGEDCSGFSPTCQDIEITGARQSTVPDCSETPLRPATWTDVKVRFR